MNDDQQARAALAISPCKYGNQLCPCQDGTALAAPEQGEVEQLSALLPGSYYMDPPDGGDVSVMEQLRRMAADAEKWRNQFAREQGETGHDSDCALHNMPAYPNGPCDCSVSEQGVVERVYLVATGETHEGRETYTRHDVPVPMADHETLYTRGAEAAQWVSVKDRLPEQKQAIWETRSGHVWPSHYNGGFASLFTSHWMPRPTPAPPDDGALA